MTLMNAGTQDDQEDPGKSAEAASEKASETSRDKDETLARTEEGRPPPPGTRQMIREVETPADQVADASRSLVGDKGAATEARATAIARAPDTAGTPGSVPRPTETPPATPAPTTEAGTGQPPPAPAPATKKEKLTATATAVAVGDEADAQARKRPTEHPATASQMRVLSVFLLIVSLATIGMIYLCFRQIDLAETSVSAATWTKPQTVRLALGPAEFNHDPKTNRIEYRGTITDETRRSLIALAQPPNDDFTRAVNELTVKSRALAKPVIYWTILLGGMGGILGVVIRSISSFVGHACYMKDLDLVVWWPWYVMNPLYGMLIAMLVIALVKTDFLTAGKASSSDALWSLSLAAIAGFGVDEVVIRLRSITQALFGKSEGGQKPETKAESKATATNQANGTVIEATTNVAPEAGKPLADKHVSDAAPKPRGEQEAKTRESAP